MKRFSIFVDGVFAGKIGATSEEEAVSVYRWCNSKTVTKFDKLTARKD
jgi:hypothetical protein